jgi:hypothetical protein
MSTEVRFSFKSANEKERFRLFAEAKGYTLSGLAKVALYQFEARNPIGGHRSKKDAGADCAPQRGGFGGGDTGEGKHL